MKRLSFILLVLLALSSCAPITTYMLDNNYQLKEASSTPNPSGVAVSDQCYRDERLTIILRQVTNDYIYLTLVNNQTTTIRILWDEAAFIDFNGYSHRINHDNSEISQTISNGRSWTRGRTTSGGTVGSVRGYSEYGGSAVTVDNAKLQVPTVIPASTSVNTFVVPADDANILRFNGLDEMTKIAEEEAAKRTFDKFQSRTAETAVKLLLPIESDGERVEYTITLMDEFQLCSVESDSVFSEFDVVVLLIPLAVLLVVAL